MTKIYKTIFALALLASVSFAQFPSSHFMNASQCLKGAVVFNAGTDALNIGSDTSIDNVFSGGGTLAGWVYLDSYGGDGTGRLWESTPNSKGAQILFTASNAVINGKWTGDDHVTTVGAVPLGKWVHLVISGDLASATDNVDFYFDGLAQTTSYIAPTGGYESDASYDKRLGNNSSSIRGLDGKVSDLKLYKGVVVSASEAQALYKGKTIPYAISAHYEFNGDASDSSGNGNDGTLAGSATITTDPFDLPPCKPLKEVCAKGAYSFGGGTDSITVADDATLDFGTGDFSVSAWVNADNPTLNADGIIGKDSFSGTSTYAGIILNCGGTGNGQWAFETREKVSGVGPRTVAVDTVDATSGWTHLTGVRTSNVLTLYVDGVLKATIAEASATNVDVSNSLFIGALASGSQHFDGSISDVRIYSEALTATQISDLYTYGREPDATLVAYYPMRWNDPAGDSSGNGNDGTVTGATYSDAIEDVPPCRSFKSPESNSLVAEYKFDNGAQDTSGNFNDGTLVGDATASGVLTLDGTGDYVDIDGVDLDGEAQGSISIWVKSDAGADGMIFDNRQFFLRLLSGTYRYDVYTTGEWIQGFGSLAFNAGSSGAGAWDHLAITVNTTSGDVKTYFNGALVKSSDTLKSGTLASDTFSGDVIGALFNGTLEWDGDIDNVRVWSAELTADEILKLYNEGHD